MSRCIHEDHVSIGWVIIWTYFGFVGGLIAGAVMFR